MTEKPKRRNVGGRPPYKPTIEGRRKVEQMKFCGESDNVIARALGIDPDTLRKHFADELADGHAQRRAEVIDLLFGAARKGNVTAMKRLDDMGRVAGAAEAVSRRAKPEPKLGKKEQQQLAADTASAGRFAPRLPPKLVVSNG